MSGAHAKLTKKQRQIKSRRTRNYQKSKQMNVNNIHFTQKSIKSTFSNGIPIMWTIGRLERNELKPRELPLIRIGWFNGQWKSIDNRRLFCYKTVKNITIIPVRVVSITNEFDDKDTTRTNGTKVQIIDDPKTLLKDEIAYAFDPILSWVLLINFSVHMNIPKFCLTFVF